jgi:hypothetical protein
MMKIDVYDTYATSAAGDTLHFDVLLPHGSQQEAALHYARRFLVSIGETAEALKAERCNFCHIEKADDAMQAHIEKVGYYILQMEGCPNPVE